MENRKKRKQRWIRAKNLMRKYPDCAYNGDFYCDHIFEPKYPWQWIDFRFFHTRLKKYFAACLVTAEYEAYQQVEDIVYEQIPYPTTMKFTENPSVERKNLFIELLDKPRTIQPRIEVKNYGSVTVGVWATVNTEFIDEHYIRDFITLFRNIGEPTKPGIVWLGEEVTVVPARLNERYKDAER